MSSARHVPGPRIVTAAQRRSPLFKEYYESRREPLFDWDLGLRGWVRWVAVSFGIRAPDQMIFGQGGQ